MYRYLISGGEFSISTLSQSILIDIVRVAKVTLLTNMVFNNMDEKKYTATGI